MKFIKYDDWPFPPCCGIQIIGEFRVQDDDFRGWNEDEVAQAKSQFVDTVRNSKGYLLASTISAQDSVEDLLKKSGWNQLEHFYNPNTGNTVQVWGFDRP